MTDLNERGLLESTMIVWMGEFGRTPKITGRGAATTSPAPGPCLRPAAASRAGQAYGKTSADGMTVEEGNRSHVPDVLATLCCGPRHRTRQSRTSRNSAARSASPKAKPIAEVLA